MSTENAWNPRARQGAGDKETAGKKVVEWSKKHVWTIVGVGALAGILLWAVWRNRKVIGMAVAEAPANGAPVPSAAPAAPSVPAPVAAPVAPAPVAVPVPMAAPMAPAACADGIPKPYNVYQDDNLAGVGSDMIGPGVASIPNGAGLPVDYAGSCSGVNPAAVWQSSQLLPAACGQSLEGTSDWNIYAPSNYQVTSFLAAGQNFGQDTISTTLKNASLDLRPEPTIPQAGCSQVPFGQSSWVDNGINRVDYSHSLIA